MQGKLQLRPSTRLNSSNSPQKKSRRNLREKSHQEFYNNRISKLSSIFFEKGYTLEQLVTEDELLKVLDALGKEPYNRELAQQLFEKIPSQGSVRGQEKRKFMLQDFVDTHIKAEYFLMLRAEEVEDELEDEYNHITNAKDELQDALNRPGEQIKMDSLQIDVVEVVCEDEEYEADIGSVFSVILVVGDYKYETEEVVIDQPMFNPKFNWNFHFKLKNPNETVKLLLRDQGRHGRDENYSDLKVAFDLKDFMARTRYEVWMPLNNHFNQPTKFKVRIQIKWPPSRVEEIENKIMTHQETEAKLNEEKEYIEMSIKKLVHPFACATAAIKAKRISMGMKSEPNIIMGKQGSEVTPELMKSVEFFKPGGVGKQVSDTGPDLAKSVELSKSQVQEQMKSSGSMSGKAQQQYNVPEQVSNPVNYTRGGSGSLVGQEQQKQQEIKKIGPYDMGDGTQIINKGKLQMNRYSTDPVNVNQGNVGGGYQGGYQERMGGMEGNTRVSMQSGGNKQTEGFGFMHPGLSGLGNFGGKQSNAGPETSIRRTKQGNGL